MKNEGNSAGGAAKVKPINVGLQTLPGGQKKPFGIQAAADYLGCKYGSLYMAVKGTPGRGRRLRDRAEVEFPALFGK